MRILSIFTSLLLMLWAGEGRAARDGHPRLLMNADDADYVAEHWESVAPFAQAVKRARSEIDPLLNAEIAVPIPKDPGGGYTHEQHKRNYKTIHDAGYLYLITGNVAYAEHAKRLLLAYTDLYPTLGEHPAKRNQNPGRLFWQSLNESVWLVHSIQGYDAIYDTLKPEERARIEDSVLRPMAAFLSDGSPRTFDRIHNHGTWAAAAVGMTGYVLDDPAMVRKALLGLDGSGTGGFLRQLDELFSPDGYYTEGPYYQRYALMPFVLFGKAIEANEPGRKIFAYRDGILLKAVYSLVHQTYGGLYFPINDAIKDKGLNTPELFYGLAIAYGQTGDASLLDIVQYQQTLVLTRDGLRLAEGLNAGKSKPFPFKSMVLRDGPRGDMGALAVLRAGKGPKHTAIVMKNTSQGMGHGHFDKLALIFYDNGAEVIQDYGAARFLNIPSKAGGRYLPENTTWAKQTVAHNTLVVDEKSHFGANWREGQKHAPELIYFDASPQASIASAHIDTAYEDTAITRTIVLLELDGLGKPVILDVMKVNADGPHQYDVPVHYDGHITHMNFDARMATQELKPLGSDNGYQHLWKMGEAGPKADPVQVTWLTGNRFYTHSTARRDGMRILFTQLGANDPDLNLLNKKAFLLRFPERRDETIISVIEPHGEYNGALEYTKLSGSQIKDIGHVNRNGMDLIRITTVTGRNAYIALSHNPDPEISHRMRMTGRSFRWNGFYHLVDETADER